GHTKGTRSRGLGHESLGNQAICCFAACRTSLRSDTDPAVAGPGNPARSCQTGRRGMAAQRGKRNLDERLQLTLACGATAEAAARSLDISERTVYRRLSDPAFRRRLQDLRAD